MQLPQSMTSHSTHLEVELSLSWHCSHFRPFRFSFFISSNLYWTTSSILFMKKFMGSWSMPFSGMGVSLRHLGQTMHVVGSWLLIRCKHCEQNVWRQARNFGLVNLSRQIAHINCSWIFSITWDELIKAAAILDCYSRKKEIDMRMSRKFISYRLQIKSAWDNAPWYGIKANNKINTIDEIIFNRLFCWSTICSSVYG